jgi:hypothetical protein
VEIRDGLSLIPTYLQGGYDGGPSSTGGEEDRRLRAPASPGGGHITGGCGGATSARAKAHVQYREGILTQKNSHLLSRMISG